MDWAAISTAFMLGLLSSAHCIGMCGGIMGALTMAVPADAQKRRVVLVTTYNLGRIGSYSLMGLLFGVFGQGFVELGGATWLRSLAGLLLIAMGLYLANWWRGLHYLEAGGRYLWAYLQPLGKPLMPVNTLTKAMLLGILWGWLPCGLVYSALVYAMAQANPLQAALLMLAFGVGTLPSVMATGLAAQFFTRFLQQRSIRWAFAVLIIGFGAWTLWGAAGHDHSQHNHTAHDHSSHDNNSHDINSHDNSQHDHAMPEPTSDTSEPVPSTMQPTMLEYEAMDVESTDAESAHHHH